MNNSEIKTEGVPVIHTHNDGSRLAVWNIRLAVTVDNKKLLSLKKLLSVNEITAELIKSDENEIQLLSKFPQTVSHELYWDTTLRNILVLEQCLGEVSSIEGLSRKNWKIRFAILEHTKGLESDKTELMKASESGDLTTVSNLLSASNRQSVSIATPSGRTALNYAVLAGKPDIVSLLINAGADVNAYGESTPLQDACIIDLKIAKLLAHAGADIDKINKYNETALMIASASGKKEVVEWLLEEGANPQIKDVFGETALDKSLKRKYDNITNLLKHVTS